LTKLEPSPFTVLALFAHPDDAEFLCAGTLAHLADRGASIHIATMTPGNCGSATFPAQKIAGIRRREAQRAAQLLHAGYTCLEQRDLLVFYDAPTLCKVLELARRVDPALVFTHSPEDYMVDHETVSRLCQTACFGASAPNFRTGARRPAKATRAIPHLYYAQPFGNRDILGNEIVPSVFVDISSTLERKEMMLACHASQQAWLQKQQSISKLFDPLEKMARRAGEFSGFALAEGFRQHLGQGFPQDNLLGALLGDLVRSVKP
jgi:LmbE family N-acetylglucosaminyl deacetylase